MEQEVNFILPPICYACGIYSHAGHNDICHSNNEQTHFDIVLLDFGQDKITTAKLIRKLKPELSLKETLDLVSNLPQIIFESIPIADAKDIEKEFIQTGAIVESK